MTTQIEANPTKALDEMRKLATKITDAVDAQKAIDANAAGQLARMFQDLDEWLSNDGDCPDQWAAEDKGY